MTPIGTLTASTGVPIPEYLHRDLGICDPFPPLPGSLRLAVTASVTAGLEKLGLPGSAHYCVGGSIQVGEGFEGGHEDSISSPK